MAAVETYQLDGQPVQVNTSDRELGDPGQAIGLVNSGDDPIYGLIADSAPDNEPGFKIDRSSEHKIALPSKKLWAWSIGRSKLLIYQFSSGEEGTLALDTVVQPLARTPARMVEPAGIADQTNMRIYNAGGGKISLVPDQVDIPDKSATITPLGTGENLVCHYHDNAAAGTIWLWTDRFIGTTALITIADPWWDIGLAR